MKPILLTLLLLSLCAVAPAAPSATIHSIALNGAAGSYSVHIKGTGPFQCDKVFLDDPPRIALDFSNVSTPLVSKTIVPKANDYVNKITVFEFWKERQKTLRVMVELKSAFDYQVAAAPDEVVLVLRSQQSSAAAVRQPVEQKEASAPAGDMPPATLAAQKQVAVTPVAETPAALSTETPASAPNPAANTPPPSVDLVIGPEDVLDVNVFDMPQFTVSGARVSGDGTISMPLVGSIAVAGLTKKQAEEKIAQALESKYVNNANVSLTIKEYKSRQVSVLGAVKTPGPYYIISQRNLLQLLSEAGGLLPEAGKKCYIFRPGASKIEVDLGQLMSGNDALNVPIMPGDVVNVPMQSKIIIYVLGAVRTPGAVELTGDMPVTLLAAVARAGGPSEQASTSHVKIKRKDAAGKETVLEANLKDIIAGKSPDITLVAGDVVNVPESFF